MLDVGGCWPGAVGGLFVERCVCTYMYRKVHVQKAGQGWQDKNNYFEVCYNVGSMHAWYFVLSPLDYRGVQLVYTQSTAKQANTTAVGQQLKKEGKVTNTFLLDNTGRGNAHGGANAKC